MIFTFRMQLSICLAVIQGYITMAGFTPEGRFDIGPAELGAMCPLIRQFGESGSSPNAVNVVDGPDGDDCVYFQWMSCDDGDSEPERPCGSYEMRKCGERKRKRREAEPFFGPENKETSDPNISPFVAFPYEADDLFEDN